jgi:hypothetical protein
MSGTPVRRTRFLGFAGLLAGALVGAAAAVLAGTAVAHRLAVSPPEAFLEATHVPPLLTAPGERVELRYDAYCATAEEATSDAPCNATGSVFVRPGQVGRFSEIALREDTEAAEGRLWAAVPTSVARSSTGFTYYAVIRSVANGRTVTLPAAGEGAPQRSLPLMSPIEVTLPAANTLGRAEKADSRVAEASWGSGTGEVGLEDTGTDVTPIGGTSFDVGQDGTVYVLDEANRRMLRWKNGVAAAAEKVALDINGTMADLSVGDDGAIHVLEGAHADERRTLLTTFTPNGKANATTEVADRASQVRIGPAGPIVLQSTSGEWSSVTNGGNALTPEAQSLSGRSGRPFGGDREVVVLRTGNEIRVALIGPGSRRRSWRVTSPTPLAEVQLAEPIADRVVVVARTYTDQASAFLVLVLGSKGIERQFSLDPADWAETAPLSRFRLRGSSLYRLGSTADGLFVDRFDLEVNR